MPRDINMRKTFREQYGEKAQSKKQKPKKAPKKKKDREKVVFRELFGARSIRMEIAYAAQDLRHVIIRYKKATTGEVKRYKVAPYSYRFRRSKKGTRRKALYAYDIDDKSIKSFYTMNIKGAEPTTSKFRPMWTVELA